MALPGPVQVIWATGERAILSLPRQEQKPSLSSVSLNTRRYRLKLRQALSLTNQIVIASTTGFQRDESLWAYLPASPVQTFAPLPLRKETPSKPPESSERTVQHISTQKQNLSFQPLLINTKNTSQNSGTAIYIRFLWPHLPLILDKMLQELPENNSILSSLPFLSKAS